MADLLTHVLVAYIVARLLSVKYPWITTPLVTAAMVGAVLPDLNRLSYVIEATTIERTLDMPFSWDGLHRGGPVAVIILICGTLVTEEHRRRVMLLMGLGAALHLVFDLFLVPTGRSFAILWPLTTWQPTLPGFYSSRDLRVTTTALAVAALTWLWSMSRSPR